MPIPYEIIDIAMMEPVYKKGALTLVICVTERIPMAFSNLLQVYKMEFRE